MCNLLTLSKQRQVNEKGKKVMETGTSANIHQISEGHIGAHNAQGNTKTVGSPSWKSPSRSTGTGTVAEFMAPREPLFVKCHTGSPNTGTGEDGFSFRAVSLLTPLILGVLMMNFFLFLFYLFSLYCLLPLPCNSVEGTEQMVLSAEARGLLRIQSQPTLQSHDHTCKESLDFPWETQMQWY